MFREVRLAVMTATVIAASLPESIDCESFPEAIVKKTWRRPRRLAETRGVKICPAEAERART
jgi:hypothetical protein